MSTALTERDLAVIGEALAFRLADEIENTDYGVEAYRAAFDKVQARRRPGRPVSQPCGTLAAYRRHLRAGEAPCDPCKAANAAHNR